MSYPHRTYCEILGECRDILKTISIFNYKIVHAHLRALHEELQTVGNRMETALYYQGDIEGLHRKKKRLQKEVDDLKKQLPDREADVDDARARISEITLGD